MRLQKDMAMIKKQAQNASIEKENTNVENLMFDISCMKHIEDNGWIYYINQEDDNVIWKIHKSGEENQSLHTESADEIERIEDGKWLYYQDEYCNSRKVTVRGKYDQEVE